MDSHTEARLIFPSGLRQPENSYRFGLDALLLAGFASRLIAGKNKKPVAPLVAEEGCGCGAALLAFAMLNPACRFLGIDREKELICCAEENAKLLGIDNCAFINCDLSFVSRIPALRPWLRKCACVMANPPWLPFSHLIRSKRQLRRSALWETPETLDAFLYAARELLAHHGIFCAILPPDHLPDFCARAAKFDLGLKRILPVANFSGDDAFRALLACIKNGASRPEISAPLLLRKKTDSGSVQSEAFLDFCPWLKGK